MHFGNGTSTGTDREWQKPRGKQGPQRPNLIYSRDVSFDPVVRDPLKHVIGAGEIGFLFGPSSAGKTFIAFDLEIAIATGRERWCERRVKPGAVLHVAFEGGRGARKRLLAAMRMHGDPGDKLAILDTAPPLNKAAGQAGVTAIVVAAAELSEVSQSLVNLIVIDTLSAAAPGDDENAASDMSAFLDKLKTIAAHTGAAVVCIHHTGKQVANGMRGSAALRGNADYVLELTEARELLIEKCREGQHGTLGAFDLEQVELGTDDDGDAVTSCVVRFRQGGNRAKAAKKLPPQAKAALDVLHNLYNEDKARHVPKDKINGVDVPKCLHISEWRDACRAKGLSKSEDEPKKKADAEKKAFGRAVEAIEAVGLIGTYGDEVWLINQNTAKPDAKEVQL